MTHFNYLSDTPSPDDEDMAQEAWCKALAKTKHRPQATTTDELIVNYQHIAGLVMHIYRHEKIKRRKKPIQTVPLTNDVGMVYNREDRLADCSPQELAAISYYLRVIDQDRPLNAAERAKLSRLRKQTGLALEVPRYTEGG